MAGPEQDHWLARPSTIRLLWAFFIVVLAALVALDLVVTHHPNFDLEAASVSARGSVLSCVVLILFAKALGALLKRPDIYYD